MPNMPPSLAPQAMPQGFDPVREIQMRRLAMAMMQNGPTAPTQPAAQGTGLLGGLASGFQNGQQIGRQAELDKMMGLPSPWDRFKALFSGAPDQTYTGGTGAP